MTSYKKTTKFKYTKNPSDVVVLREYILFEDSAQGSKSALLKFCNNLDQKLFGVQFEVYQYDEADSLIAKSLVVYDKFTAEANAEFVPKAKLKLSENCASISVKLISADFDRIRWEKGSFTDTGYEFKRYVAEANKTQKEQENNCLSNARGESEEHGEISARFQHFGGGARYSVLHRHRHMVQANLSARNHRRLRR